MTKCKRELTKEQYENHDGNFTDSEVMGYGVYLPRFFEENGKYFVEYELGSSCD